MQSYADILTAHLKRKRIIWLMRSDSQPFAQAVEKLHQMGMKLQGQFNLQYLEPIKIAPRSKIFINRFTRCALYLQACYNERKIFIKYTDFEQMHETEYKFCNRLHQVNNINFPEALFYSNTDGFHCIAYEYVDGITLLDKIASKNFSSAERENIILQLKEIAMTLEKTSVVHRDIHLGNFVVTNDGKLKLIDFEWCVDSERYEECDFIKKNSLRILGKPSDFSISYRWDDAVSLLKVLESIGSCEQSSSAYREVEAFLNSRIGKRVVSHRYCHLLVVPGAFRRFGAMFNRCVKRLRKLV